MHMVSKDHSTQARGLGDRALYQSYFVCVEEKEGAVTIKYGIARENQVNDKTDRLFYIISFQLNYICKQI